MEFGTNTKNCLAGSFKLNITNDPVISLLGIYPIEMHACLLKDTYKNVHSSIMIAKYLKLPKYS